MSSALQTNRWAPLALLSGVVVSYTTMGTLLALFGSGLGIDARHVKTASAILMLLLGAMFLLPVLQQAFIKLTTPFTDTANTRLSSFRADSVLTQGLLGMMLGVVWTPCIGPTLGAAITMAACGNNYWHTLLTMLVFGIGAALPMGVLAYGSRATISNTKKTMAVAGRRGKKMMGLALLLVGGLIITGSDKSLETLLTSHMPSMLQDLTTRF
jgi:cytochrome c-type biogenesis protein